MERMTSLAALVAETFEAMLRETPDVFDASDVFEQRTYRERLDRQWRNGYGELIPRIVTVRRNLRRLGTVRLNPARLP
jgi:hypothetical protein